MSRNKVLFEDLGAMPYKEAWGYQEALFDEMVDIKLHNRDNPQSEREQKNHLLFVEHPPVITLGKSGKEEHLLIDKDNPTVEFYKINRGGDITFHGPGQLVVYPLLDLDLFFTDIHKYLRFLEDVVIKILADYGIEGSRLPGATGVWLEPGSPSRARKICAMGIRCSRWITMHGLALNVNTKLDWFNNIVPCGIGDKQVTSMQKELGYEVPMEEVKVKMKEYFGEIFEVDLIGK